MVDICHKLALIIATVGRCPDLRRMVESLAQQTRAPDQVIIVDEAGEGSSLAREFPQLNIAVTTFPRGSASAKRNLGMQSVDPDIDLISFVDDDIVMDSYALEAIHDFWSAAPADLGGVGCNLVNHPPQFASRWKSLKLASRLALYDARGGLVLRSGFQTLIGFVAKTQYVQWLPSTAVVYRRKALAEYPFDEWYKGYSYLEDLDLSYSVGKKYRLAVLAEARYWHYPSSVGRTDSYPFGRMEVANRFHFVGKYPELSAARCFLALTIRLLMSIFLGLTRLEGAYFQRAAGNVVGLLSQVTQRFEAAA